LLTLHRLGFYQQYVIIKGLGFRIQKKVLEPSGDFFKSLSEMACFEVFQRFLNKLFCNTPKIWDTIDNFKAGVRSSAGLPVARFFEKGF